MLLAVYRHCLPSYSRRGRFALVFLLLCLTGNVADNFKRMVSSDDRSPYRPLAEKGFSQVVDFLNMTFPTERILSPKDVGRYYVGAHYNLDGMGDEFVIRHIENRDFTLLVDSLAFSNLSGRNALEARFGLRQIAQLGDFTVLANGDAMNRFGLGSSHGGRSSGSLSPRIPTATRKHPMDEMGCASIP